MAIAPTGTIYKAFTFDGASSRDYGVYITGEAVYNAPKRAVEMVSIPGRNGAFALDNGRFENVEVTYPAGIFADTETNFADAVSDLRNLLCSKSGYVRLSDEYNPNEYRMAVYKNGLEVTPAMLKAGEFNITFECMPQRWLTSGEAAVTVANNGTLTNPTRFDAKPLLQVWGYGDMLINDYALTINQAGTIGRYALMHDVNLSSSLPFTINNGLTKTGDTVKFDNVAYSFSLIDANNTEFDSATPLHNENIDISTKGIISTDYSAVDAFVCTISNGASNFTYSTSFNVYAYDGETLKGAKIGVGVTIRYEYSTGKVSLREAYFDVNQIQGTPLLDLNLSIGNYFCSIGEIEINSTVSLSSKPINIDFDIGEAYFDINGYLLSANRYTILGADLPVLKPGNNSLTYDNTFSQVKVTPRWWKV